MKQPKKSTVTKRTTDEDKLSSIRWQAFIKASGLPYDQLTEEWASFFSAQSEIETAEVELVRLIDIAIKKDLNNVGRG